MWKASTRIRTLKTERERKMKQSEPELSQCFVLTECETSL